MTRPVLLDLFCGAGGAAMGYDRAGFEVVGVDIDPQPSYPFEFIQADALTFPLRGFDAIHASPPCQAFSYLRHRTGREYSDLLNATRMMVWAAGKPYVIENVPGAPLHSPVLLCGSMFHLEVRRHRLFESPLWMPSPGKCRHDLLPFPIDVSGSGGRQLKPREKDNGGRGRKPINIEEARRVMDMPWATRRGISQAIPPAYTEWIGGHLMAAFR